MSSNSQSRGSFNAKDVILRVENVSVAFTNGRDSIPVTHDVSFELRRGETIALVGESGSGKSVTAMSILGLLPGNSTVSGSVRLGDAELIGASEPTLRSVRGARIGVIFQEPMTALNPVYTIGALIGQALESHGRMPHQRVRRRILELLEMVQMPEPELKLRQYPHQLSGGQRQRAMIAMAISCEPDILIADEPTTALDVTVQAGILDLLQSLQKRLGMAMIFITHDMGVVAQVADRVCVMSKGRVVEEADVFDLFASPKEEYTQALLAAVPRPGVVVGAGRTADRSDRDESVREHAVEVRNLSVIYSGRFGRQGFTAVDNVSFRVPAGEIVGLVGESGSGKSTIGRTIIGLVPASGGSIMLNGTDVGGLRGGRLRAARRSMSIVFQDPASSLNPRAPIGMSAVDPLRLHGIVRGQSALRKRAAELLEQVELPGSWIDRYPHELSGGQRQRIGIARAISLEPDLLIADEPTSSLDVSVQATVLELFKDLQRDLGFSCLFISHDLAVVESLSSSVIVLRRGTVVEQGLSSAILRAPAEEYTRQLIGAAPIPDPVEQRRRAAARNS